MTHLIATDIKNRFVNEQRFIQRYIAFAAKKSSIDDRRILDLNRALWMQGISKFPYRSVQDMMISLKFSALQLDDLLRFVNTITPATNQALASTNAFLRDQPFGNVPDEEDDSIDIYEMVFDIVESVESCPDVHIFLDDVLVEKVKNYIKCKIMEFCISPKTTNGVKTSLLIAVAEITNATVNRWLENRVSRLEYILAEFEEIRLIARASGPGSEINVLRQGFILLMTAFDAVVFDLVRVALRTKFFTLAKAFDKNDKTTLSEITAAGSFEAIRDKIIEEQLKKRYLKDVLRLLNDMWEVKCVAPNSTEKFERLIELVLRRNLHVHNRGVADARHIESMNLDRLKIGDIAVIDESYWEMANTMCQYCVEQVATWAGTE